MADHSLPALNLPDVHAEVTRCFLAYDAALLAGDVEALGHWFFDGAETTRFGIGEELYGAEQVAAWRRSAPPLVRAPLRRYDIVTMAEDVAVVTAEFDDHQSVGRQSQTWVRCGEGWRVLSGHVSTRCTVGA